MATTKLSNLTRAEKVALLEMLEEKSRKAIERQEGYVPTKEQLSVITSPAYERYLYCGNGFGKTALLVNEIHWAAMGHNPITKKTTLTPAKMVLLLDSPEKADDIVTEYRKWAPLLPSQLHKKGKANYSYISYPNGSSLTIYSHEVNPLKLEGSEWTHVFFDEPPPRPCFISLMRGGRIKGRPLRVLLAGTPISAAWMRREIYEPWSKGELKNTACFKGSSYSNKSNLADGALERFSARLSEKEKNIRLEGDFFDLDGLALAHIFSRETHVLSRLKFEYKSEYPCVVAIDPHPSKNHVAVMVTVDEHNQMYYVRELSRKLPAREFARELKDWYRGYRVVDVVCDSLGSADTTGGEGFKSFIQVLNEQGIRCRATSWDEKQDEAFIARIQDVLLKPDVEDNFGRKVPKLRILEGNNGIINDIESACWVKHKGLDEFKPKLDISNQDYLACLKYALATNLVVTRGQTRAFYNTKKAYGIDLSPKSFAWSRR